ncbi:MAG: LacI family DNA-binding transcriptional regulator [Pseudomonadota bacterium]
MHRRKRANLRDVAERSGVSVATVSRVLNTPMRVSETTRSRVEDAIRDLRFTRSAAARAINTGRSNTIGALIPTLDHAIFAKFLGRLEQDLSARGLSLLVSTTGSDPAVELRKAEALLDIGVEGLIVSGMDHAQGFDDLIARFGVPVVLTSVYSQNARYPTIGYDNRSVAQTALGHLADLGHRRIAVIHGPTAQNDRTRARIAGLETSGLPVELSFAEGRLGVSGGVQAVVDLPRGANRPTAILCLSDVLALGALFELNRQGVAVPEDMSLMGIDDLAWARSSAPGLTTVRLPAEEMGARTAVAISAWVAEGDRPRSERLTEELITRASTRSIVSTG